MNLQIIVTLTIASPFLILGSAIMYEGATYQPPLLSCIHREGHEQGGGYVYVGYDTPCHVPKGQMMAHLMAPGILFLSIGGITLVIGLGVLSEIKPTDKAISTSMRYRVV